MLLSYVEAKPEASDVVMCVLREGPSGRAAEESNFKFEVLHEGSAGALVDWLTAPGVWSTNCDQPGVIFKRKGENLERLYSTGQYAASLTKYSSWLDTKLTVQYRLDGALRPETVEIEKVDEMTQRSTFSPTDDSKRVTKEKKRCPCDALTPNVQEFCKRPH
jgi:hypothetical protein